ncbi:hypothetical protein [Phycicoccus jejuensis]|uniref:hypothetical protein n=1 Tax=Phycicoccus jejuensis TaxID=367299 RepID=UPI0004C3BCE8|nr:hypothetical protein [Phycicoccus jejuensis]
MTEMHPALLAKLVRSVAVLALPYEDQVSWLSSLGLGRPEFTDELAQELGDGARLGGQFVDAGWLTPEACQKINEIDALLSSRGGPANEEFWRLEALRMSPEWARVRKLALSVLATL